MGKKTFQLFDDDLEFDISEVKDSEIKKALREVAKKFNARVIDRSEDIHDWAEDHGARQNDDGEWEV